VEAGILTLFGTTIEHLEERTEGVSLKTSEAEILARHAFICTNGFAAQFIKDESIQPARAQVLITEPIPDLKLRGTFHYQEGYYYFRNIDQRILFGGGRNLDFEGETTTTIDTTPHIMEALKQLLHAVIAPGQDIRIAQEWAGIMGVGTHKQPIIRRLSEHLSCGVRLGGMGVAIGTLVGQELAAGINS
jgi:glycine/D-amino acid oxidase-like deaminating enzyme